MLGEGSTEEQQVQQARLYSAKEHASRSAAFYTAQSCPTLSRVRTGINPRTVCRELLSNSLAALEVLNRLNAIYAAEKEAHHVLTQSLTQQQGTGSVKLAEIFPGDEECEF